MAYRTKATKKHSRATKKHSRTKKYTRKNRMFKKGGLPEQYMPPKDHYTRVQNMRNDFMDAVRWWNNQKMDMDYINKIDIVPVVEEIIKKGFIDPNGSESKFFEKDHAYLFLIALKNKHLNPKDENYKKVVNDLLQKHYFTEYCIEDESGVGCSISGGKRRSKRHRRHHY